MKTKYLIVVWIFLGVNLMFGVWWFSSSKQIRGVEESIQQAYEIWDYPTVLDMDFELYEWISSYWQEQVVLAYIKSSDLTTAQSLIERTTNPTVNTRLYNKLITFTLEENRNAVERIVVNERSNIATIRALLIYFRALVAYETWAYENAQVLLEQSLNLDGLAWASHLLWAKIAPKLEFRPWSKVNAYFQSAQELWAKFTDLDRYNRWVVKFYTWERKQMRQYFDMIQNPEFEIVSQIIFDGRDKLWLQEYEAALYSFNTALQYDTDNWIPYLWKWRTFAAMQQRDNAQKHYEKGLEKSLNREILVDLLTVYDELWDDGAIRTTSLQIEQILWSNVWVHTWVLRRFIAIYEPTYIKQYADDMLGKYRNGRFEREDADQRYQDNVQSLYATIQNAYITLMTNRRSLWRSWDQYRDMLVNTNDRTSIADIYLMFAFERTGDKVAAQRILDTIDDFSAREIAVLRILNRINLQEYSLAWSELDAVQNDLTELDMLWLSWKVADWLWQRLLWVESDLRSLLDATNEEILTLGDGFANHFSRENSKITAFYPPVEE